MLVHGTSIAESFHPPELSFGLLALYLVVSFLLAWLPYVMNINSSQSIRVKAIVEERNRLSRDMHDGLAQALGIIKWKVQLLSKAVASGNVMQSLNDLKEITEMLEGTQREAKAVIDELRTTITGDRGFVPTLAKYASDFTREFGVRCELRVSDGLVKLDSLAELQLLYVAQEALSNVRKHARARTIHVSLESKADHTEMIIRDDGCGFDPGIETEGHGLMVMRERIDSVGGQLIISSRPGQGTEVNVKLPGLKSLS